MNIQLQILLLFHGSRDIQFMISVLKKFKNLRRWYEIISKREAVIKGYDCLKKEETIPKA